MKKILLNIFVIFLFVGAVEAQQPFFFSQFHEAAPAFNPAFTGIDEFLDVKLIRRNQWSGFEGSPTTNYIGVYNSIHKEEIISIKEFSLRISNPHLYDSTLAIAPKVKDKIKHGYGGNIIYDTQSPFSQIIGNLNYSLHLNMNDNFYLAFGLNIGIRNQKIDLNKINLRNPDEDEFFQRLITQGGNTTNLSVNPGILIYYKSGYFGYSVGNLLSVDVESSEISNDLNKMVHNIQVGYQFPLGEYLRLQSSIYYYYYDKNVNSLDANIKLNINNRGYFGTSYRTTNDLVLMGGIYLQHKFHLGYSYDMKISGRNDLNNGSHEITLGFLLFNDDLRFPFVW